MKIDRDSNSLTLNTGVDITSANLEEIRAKILEEMDDALSEIIIDLEKVSLVDSSGISLLVSIQNTLKKQSGQLKLINVSEDIQRMFKLMRLDQHITITD
jgi:anti-sigma B factor antagonist